MDELGFNKIAAAILATALGYMGIKELSHAVIHVEAPAVPAYALDIPEAAGAVEEVELPFPQADWIAAMDADRGARVFKKCTSCHNAESGGANGTGPNLWNVPGPEALVEAAPMDESTVVVESPESEVPLGTEPEMEKPDMENNQC